MEGHLIRYGVGYFDHAGAIFDNYHNLWYYNMILG
jgi:hypothetical protein